MLARMPDDANFRQQLAHECERIRKECPTFVKYLQMSVEYTSDAEDDEVRTEWLLKLSGAKGDLKRILSVIAEPLLSVEKTQGGLF